MYEYPSRHVHTKKKGRPLVQLTISCPVKWTPMTATRRTQKKKKLFFLLVRGVSKKNPLHSSITGFFLHEPPKQVYYAPQTRFILLPTSKGVGSLYRFHQQRQHARAFSRKLSREPSQPSRYKSNFHLQWRKQRHPQWLYRPKEQKVKNKEFSKVVGNGIP